MIYTTYIYIFLMTGGWCQHCFTHNASLGWDPIRHFPTEMVVLVAFGLVPEVLKNEGLHLNMNSHSESHYFRQMDGKLTTNGPMVQ